MITCHQFFKCTLKTLWYFTLNGILYINKKQKIWIFLTDIFYLTFSLTTQWSSNTFFVRIQKTKYILFFLAFSAYLVVCNFCFTFSVLKFSTCFDAYIYIYIHTYVHHEHSEVPEHDVACTRLMSGGILESMYIMNHAKKATSL